jgi:hypothetical protein
MNGDRDGGRVRWTTLADGSSFCRGKAPVILYLGI